MTGVQTCALPIWKEDFFAELLASKPAAGTMWLVLGDFNQIFRARDKNNTNINRRRMNKFKATLDNCDLKPIHLQNRRYTWSNEQANPTMSRIDGVFCNPEWDLSFGNHILHGLSSSLSDHCPLLLADDSGPRRPRSFRFENFWTCLPGFKEIVKEAWTMHTPHQEPCQILFHKLKKTGAKLKRWSQSFFSNAKVQTHIIGRAHV